jgi:hypothetical protein
MRDRILLFIGAVVGGVAGYFLFFWLAHQGFYAIILPGCLLGFGAGLVKTRSLSSCIVCGLLALALGVFTEWRFAPFSLDHSFGFFLSHLHELRPITWILIGLGTFFGFYSPFRNGKPSEQKQPEKSGGSTASGTF